MAACVAVGSRQARTLHIHPPAVWRTSGGQAPALPGRPFRSGGAAPLQGAPPAARQSNETLARRRREPTPISSPGGTRRGMHDAPLTSGISPACVACRPRSGGGQATTSEGRRPRRRRLAGAQPPRRDVGLQRPHHPPHPRITERLPASGGNPFLRVQPGVPVGHWREAISRWLEPCRRSLPRGDGTQYGPTPRPPEGGLRGRLQETPEECRGGAWGWLCRSGRYLGNRWFPPLPSRDDSGGSRGPSERGVRGVLRGLG